MDELPGELWGLPETVHVDALGRLVLPLAVLLESDLLVHAQSMHSCSGLHKRPRDESGWKTHGQLVSNPLRARKTAPGDAMLPQGLLTLTPQVERPLLPLPSHFFSIVTISQHTVQ